MDIEMDIEYSVCVICFNEYGGIDEYDFKNAILTHNENECVLCKVGSEDVKHFVCEQCATIKEWKDFHYPRDDNEDEVDWFRCKKCVVNQ
jgi:Fe2+ or Zn2+ uptake regulation protein